MQRREEHRADAEPLEARDRADDVRDRVQRADFVEVDFLDGHVMDRRFGLAQAREDRDRALLHALRQARAEDHPADRLQAAARAVRLVGGLDGHLQRADAAAQGLLGAEPDQPGREQREVGHERLQRQPAVEQRPRLSCAIIACSWGAWARRAWTPAARSLLDVYAELLNGLQQHFTFIYISESKRDDYGLPGKVIPPGIDVEDYGGYTGDVAGAVAQAMRRR